MQQRLIQNKFARGSTLIGVALLCVCVCAANAAELHVPGVVEAGQAFSIHLEGSGQATFYLVGPDTVVKRTVNLGSDLQIQSGEIQAAGRYRVILCDQACTSTTFEVKASQPAHLSFFLHPSRVPVSSRDSIEATAFVFDPFFNLVLTPDTVDFRVTPASGAAFSRQAVAHNGVTWMRMDSTPHEGPVKVTAVAGKVEEARVVQQVAAEACGLHVKAAETGNIATLETDPVRDCSGNALPDGTIVSFTKSDRDGRSTVDVPIKKSIAKAQFSIAGPAQISVACGVVLGNEVALNGKL
jgi:hypothetical protein